MAGSGWTAAYVLSLIGGVLIIFGATGILAVGESISAPFGWPDYSYLLCGVLGILLGIVTVIGAAIAFQRPNTGVVLGSLMIVISMVSWIVALGGMIIGSALTFVGGLLFIVTRPVKKIPGHLSYEPFAYEPPQQPPYVAVKPEGHVPSPSHGQGSLADKQEPLATRQTAVSDAKCRHCGQIVEADLSFCPYCGFRVR